MGMMGYSRIFLAHDRLMICQQVPQGGESTTQLKKKRRTSSLINEIGMKINFNYFLRVRGQFERVLKKSINLDQSQVCISNGLEALVC